MSDITEQKRAEERERLLSLASAEFSSSLDYELTLKRVSQLAVGKVADFCMIDLLDEDGSLRQIAVAHVNPAQEELLREIRRIMPHDPSRTVGVAQVIRSGQPEFVPAITPQVLNTYVTDKRQKEITDELGTISYMIVPLQARGRTFGTLACCNAESGHYYSEDDLRFVMKLAERAAIAVDNARLFRQAQQAREVAEEANRAKDEFLATLSHELRTPLNAVLGWANLMANGRLNLEEAQQAGEIIERNVRVQAQLLNDLFDVSRVITGKLHLDVQPVDLVKLVRNATESVSTSTQAKEIELVIETDEKNLWVSGDSTRLQQVLWNLLSNAVRFTPVGGNISVRLHRHGEFAVMAVADSGEGIEPGFLPHVFDRFRQADSSSTRKHGGMGLGLSIVRHLTELHGGIVEAYSDGLGRGATFVVRLPLMREMAQQNGTDGKKADSIRLVDMPRALHQMLRDDMLQGLRLLVVEDENDTRDLIASVLLHYGAAVDVAASVDEALELLKTLRPDVIVSDISMPDEDGYSFMQRVRKLPVEQGSQAFGVALTALASSDDRRKALAVGFHEHIAKPIDPAALVVTIAALVERI